MGSLTLTDVKTGKVEEFDDKKGFKPVDTSNLKTTDEFGTPLTALEQLRQMNRGDRVEDEEVNW